MKMAKVDAEHILLSKLLIETKHLPGRSAFGGHIETCIKADNNVQKI
jgi:hypothetical protein